MDEGQRGFRQRAVLGVERGEGRAAGGVVVEETGDGAEGEGEELARDQPIPPAGGPPQVEEGSRQEVGKEFLSDLVFWFRDKIGTKNIEVN